MILWVWLFCGFGYFVGFVISWVWRFCGFGDFVGLAISWVWRFRGFGDFVGIMIDSSFYKYLGVINVKSAEPTGDI